MTNEIIKVVLADDHILLRNALATMLDATGECKVIGQASNGKDLLNMLQNGMTPDVVILDLNMPVLGGQETAVTLQSQYPEIRVLMLTMYDSELALIRLLQTGVRGFMKKDIHPQEMLTAIRSVMESGYYYSSHTGIKLAGLFRDMQDKNALYQKVMLSEQEINFLRYSCTEMTYKEIAEKMKLNPRAVDGIRDELFHRLDVKSRVGLAMYTIRHGLVTL
jgi:two-component system, NarL family, invasion response regulator UvrY